MEQVLHVLGTLAWGVAFAGLVSFLGFHGYYAGYWVGAFYVMYYHLGYELLTTQRTITHKEHLI